MWLHIGYQCIISNQCAIVAHQLFLRAVDILDFLPFGWWCWTEVVASAETVGFILKPIRINLRDYTKILLDSLPTGGHRIYPVNIGTLNKATPDYNKISVSEADTSPDSQWTKNRQKQQILNILNSQSLPLNWSHGDYLLTKSHESYLRKGKLKNGSHSFFFILQLHIIYSPPFLVFGLWLDVMRHGDIWCVQTAHKNTIIHLSRLQHPWTVWDAKDLWYVFFYYYYLFIFFSHC